jgi:hypothetical protein
VLDAGAVVPAAVEEDHLAGRRQVRHVTLEVPLRALALGRRPQRDRADDPRARHLGDALDHAALAGGVATLEEHDDAQPGVHDPLLQAHELLLQPRELAYVLLLRQPARGLGHLAGIGHAACTFSKSGAGRQIVIR